jgi:hypothetical protein
MTRVAMTRSVNTRSWPGPALAVAAAALQQPGLLLCHPRPGLRGRLPSRDRHAKITSSRPGILLSHTES